MKKTANRDNMNEKSTYRFVLTDTHENIEIRDYIVENTDLEIYDSVPFKVWKKTLHGGKQEGSTLIGVETGELSVTVIPTRGMSLHKARFCGFDYGWASPVDEIVHPAFMRLSERGEVGWLDGFNELMVRCGFEWSGHPCAEDSVAYSLHGRAGNTPASRVTVGIERQAPHRIRISGLLKEKAFKFSDFEILTELIVTPGSALLSVHDRIVNLSDYDRAYQIIYHTNFGRPILGKGARFLAPVKCIAPFNERAKAGLATWQVYAGPTHNFDEEVFVCELFGDSIGQTVTALVDPSNSAGVALRFNTGELPYFTLWKNTDTNRQGYVTGLEPGSSYSYSRAVEKARGRLQTLGPNEARDFRIDIQFLTTTLELAAVTSEIDNIRAGRDALVAYEPIFSTN